jgi:hypothetical protein
MAKAKSLAACTCYILYDGRNGDADVFDKVKGNIYS